MGLFLNEYDWVDSLDDMNPLLASKQKHVTIKIML